MSRAFTPAERRARALALLLPAALLAGAWFSQLVGHLYPCEMCHWQRWPHYAALPFALLAFVVPQRSIAKALVVIAALLIAVSGAIGVAHAGVEYHWWEGFMASLLAEYSLVNQCLVARQMHQKYVLYT